MEQHPVPQNVTTFQFRLIGDMTIKQFGYLAGGIIVGYVCYKLPLPFFFTWPLAITSGLLGFGLAFVPVEERPMDIWIASFFRNTYSPTQWIWSHEAKSGSAGQKTVPHELPASVAQPAPTHNATLLEQLSTVFLSWLRPVVTTTQQDVKRVKLPTPFTHPGSLPLPQTPSIAVATAPVAHAATPPHKSFGLFAWITSFFHNQPKPPPALSPGFSFADAFASQPHVPVVGSRPNPPAREPQKAPEIPTQTTSPHPIVPVPNQTNVAPKAPLVDGHQHIASLQGQLTDMMRDRERLEKELIAMRQKMDRQVTAPPSQPMRQATTVSVNHQAGPTVRVIAPGAAVSAGLPRLTTFPNVVTGIVKDQYGNLLAGMLITVRDHDDVPLRALKTNRLGQFAASTPLPNNTYIVEIEDPKGGFHFDKAQIQLTGGLIPPLEVTAKSQRQVERDRLAKEIFGTNQM